MTRPDRKWIHMRTAMLWANRSSCLIPDRKIGAIITSQDYRRVLAIGYNGPPRGQDCVYVPEVAPVGDGLFLPIPSRCTCVHAEMNALAHLQSTEENLVMFATMAPCSVCAGLICNTRIHRVFFANEYRNPECFRILSNAKILIHQLDANASSS